MSYRELVQKVQNYSGFSRNESEVALKVFVKKLAARLKPDAREKLAKHLPRNLRKYALTLESSDVKTASDFMQQVCEEANVTEYRAVQQVICSWEAIKDTVNESVIESIKAQLPRDLAIRF